VDDIEFCRHFEIAAEALRIWIDEGWVAPASVDGARRYSDVDLARARLIEDLTERMGVNEAGVDIALSLLDQLHGLRSVMRDVFAALAREDPQVRLRLLASLDG
jgi:chaperone modulatory protein CbpM